jgi:hypothetical protein
VNAVDSTIRAAAFLCGTGQVAERVGVQAPPDRLVD